MTAPGLRALMLSVFLVAAVWAQAPVQTTLSADRYTGTVGTRLELSLVVKSTRALGELDVSPPEHPAFRIIKSLPEERQEAAGVLTLRRRWLLACFEVGTHQIGPLNVKVRTGTNDWERLETNPIEVEIHSVLAEGDQDILPPKAPLELKGSPRRLITLLLALGGVLLLLVLFLYWRRSRHVRVSSRTHRLPWEQLEEDLKALRRDRLLEKGQYEWFFVRMTQVLRQYLARILDCPAEEWTTGEILEKLAQEEWEAELMSVWKQVLGEADLVKFARFAPGSDGSIRLWAHLEQILAQARTRQQMLSTEEAGNGSLG